MGWIIYWGLFGLFISVNPHFFLSNITILIGIIIWIFGVISGIWWFQSVRQSIQSKWVGGIKDKFLNVIWMLIWGTLGLLSCVGGVLGVVLGVMNGNLGVTLSGMEILLGGILFWFIAVIFTQQKWECGEDRHPYD